MASNIGALVDWIGLHPGISTGIWLLIGITLLIIAEAIRGEYEWPYRIMVILAWPAFLVAGVIIFILAIFFG